RVSISPSTGGETRCRAWRGSCATTGGAWCNWPSRPFFDESSSGRPHLPVGPVAPSKDIVVSAPVANKYQNGGIAWVALSYVLGLRKLGFRVYLVEEIKRRDCMDEAGAQAAFEDSANLAYFRRLTNDFDLAGAAALVCEGGEQTDGLPLPELMEVAETAELLVNVSGHLTTPELMRR